MKYDLANADYTNMRGVIPSLAPAPQLVDAPGGKGKEYEWNNVNWNEQWGIFNSLPDFRSAEIIKGVLLFGQGYTTDALTDVTLQRIKGWGKQNFRDILFSMDVTKRVGGDAYAQIIKDKGDNLLNLKEIPPGGMWQIYTPQGILKAYELRQNVPGQKAKQRFKPEDIFHVTHNRYSGECHGRSDLDSLMSTVLADYENFENLRKIMRHQAFPFILWKLKTDDPIKIAKFMEKLAECRKYKEDFVIPDDENAVSHEVVQMSPSALVGQWELIVRNRFYRAIQLSQIQAGAQGLGTESSDKVVAKLGEQIPASDQLKWKEDIYKQLFFTIDFNPPVSIEAAMPGLASDEAKDSGSLAPQPSDTKIGAGGVA